MPRRFALLAIQFQSGSAGQPPLRAVYHRHHHLQVAQQFGAGSRGRRGWSFLPRLSLRLEKQLRIVQKASAHRRRTLAPGPIQLAGSTRIAVMPGEDRRQALAILQALACHRHQKLHRHLRADLALPHLLLNRFR